MIAHGVPFWLANGTTMHSWRLVFDLSDGVNYEQKHDEIEYSISAMDLFEILSNALPSSSRRARNIAIGRTPLRAQRSSSPLDGPLSSAIRDECSTSVGFRLLVP
jgi:hypothetical protein